MVMCPDQQRVILLRPVWGVAYHMAIGSTILCSTTSSSEVPASPGQQVLKCLRDSVTAYKASSWLAIPVISLQPPLAIRRRVDVAVTAGWHCVFVTSVLQVLLHVLHCAFCGSRPAFCGVQN
jgi:hypothetical protein